MSNKAREMKAKGIDVISLTLGEPDFDVPANVKKAAITAIHENYSHYSPIPGFMELREAVSRKLKRDNGLDYQPTQICISNGGKQSIINILLALLNDGDEVILPVPYWVSYAEMTKLAGGVPIFIKTSYETEFKITAEQLEKAITPKTKILLYSSPCNPSGSYYTKEELVAIAKVIEKNPQITVISDEIYEFLNYEEKHISIINAYPNIYEQVAIVNGMSKGYAMTGWRIGYSVCPEWLAKGCDKIQGQLTSGANTIAQRAAIEALNTDPKEYQYMVDSFKKRRDITYNLLKDIKGFKVSLPKSAFYFFVDISYYLGKHLNGVLIKNSDDLAMYLLENTYVASVGGTSFGAKIDIFCEITR